VHRFLLASVLSYCIPLSRSLSSADALTSILALQEPQAARSYSETLAGRPGTQIRAAEPHLGWVSLRALVKRSEQRKPGHISEYSASCRADDLRYMAEKYGRVRCVRLSPHIHAVSVDLSMHVPQLRFATSPKQSYTLSAGTSTYQ
jgi:hypothetical protein